MADNRIIAVINQKGGTGKTTLALNLAAGLARRGSTHLVDADPQRSITQWVGMGGGRFGFAGRRPTGRQPGCHPHQAGAQPPLCGGGLSAFGTR